jgi:hypothetical protein
MYRLTPAKLPDRQTAVKLGQEVPVVVSLVIALVIALVIDRPPISSRGLSRRMSQARKTPPPGLHPSRTLQDAV